MAGPAGSRWTALRGADRWAVITEHSAPDAEVITDADTLWRLASKGIGPRAARDRWR